MEEFEDLVYVEGHWVRGYLRRKPECRPSLTERVMGNPDDCRNLVLRKSFEDAFRRMGFPPRRRPY